MYRRSLRRLLACLALPLLLAACANPAIREADSLRAAGQYEAALSKLQTAHQAKPADATLKAAYVKQRDSTVAYLIYQAEAARAAGQMAEHVQFLQRIEAAAPNDPRAASLRADMTRRKRTASLMDEATAAFKSGDFGRAETALRALLADDIGHSGARSLLAQIDEKRAEQTRRQTSVKLATSQKPVTLEFREASLRTVFESLARAANVNFVLDKDVRGDAKVTLFMRNTTVDEALRVILSTQQLGFRLLNDNTVLVYPNTSQKQRDLLDTVTRSFYLVNADPKQAMALVRTVAKTRDMFVDDRLNLLIVRDTPEVVRLIERLIAGIDLPDPEVMLELEVMEVSSKRVNELGLSWPEVMNYGVPGSTELITSATTGMRWSTANPVAVATLKGGTDYANLLANPRVRARNREKAKVLLGEKLPVFTTTSTANVGVSASVSYLDVGLKLELEPQVQLDNEVIIKVALEVSSITGRVSGPQGSLAYQVGTRQATTSLRLRDGETQVLAGLINDDESKNAAGLPWLHDLPGLGRLFGKTTDTHNKTEVVLLITPRVIRNLNQSQLPTAAMPSGTEAQPGAAPFVLNQSLVSTQGQPVSPTPAPAPVSPATPPTVAPPPSPPSPGGSLGPSTGAAPRPQAVPFLSGPETVMPNASFQITVHNPTKEQLDTELLFDPTVFEVAGDANGEGRVTLRVFPRGTFPVGVSIKEGVFGRPAELRLDRAGQPLNIIIGEPEP